MPGAAAPAGNDVDDGMGDDVGDAVVLHRVVVGALATNCWLVHAVGDRSTLLVDPGDEPQRILDALAHPPGPRDGVDTGPEVVAIVLTHAHFDHVLAVPALVAALDAPVLAHPADAPVWPGELDHLHRHGHWDAGTATADLLRNDATTLTPSPRWRPWDGITEPVTDGHQIQLGPLTATLLHTPGHTPGGLTVAIGSHLITGDTLFPGGPGLTGNRWPTSDFDTIMRSVERLMTWPDDTTVHPGHGPDTNIGKERPHMPSWRARGW
jgi:glyoxylase-like metal-dependent hydrolase (beta-lactamase superfamily II)